MATTKNIIMKQFNGTDYDTLYPKTNVEQVENLTPSSIGAVAKTGDTMTGNLSINKSTPEIDFKNTAITDGRFGYVMMASDKTFNIGNYLNGSNKQALYIQPETAVLKNAIRLLRTIDGTTKYYSVLHEGNLSDLGVARIATGTYVGTGTYGADNPNSLTFDFVPKAVFIIGTKDSDGVHHAYMFGYDTGGNGLSQQTAMYYDLLTTNYVESVGFGIPYGSGKSHFGKRSNDGKTFSWYADYSSSYQFNDAGTTFYYMALY